MRKSNRGFTLVEMMVVVAIVAILAAIAYPSYMSSIRKSRRSEAINNLALAHQTMERFYTENNYRYDQDRAGAAMNIARLRGLVPSLGTATYYNFAFSAGPTANTFSLQASPRPGGSQVADTCGNFSIDNTGAKAISGTGICW